MHILKRKTPNVIKAFWIMLIIPLSAPGETHTFHELEAKVEGISQKQTLHESQRQNDIQHVQNELQSTHSLHQTSINAVLESSKAAINSATKALDTNFYIVSIGTFLVTCLVGFGVYLGYNDRRTIKQEHADFVQESRDKIEKLMACVPAFCIDMAIFKDDLYRYQSSFVEDSKLIPSAKESTKRLKEKTILIKDAEVAMEKAKELDDRRSISWLYSEIAMLHYYEGDYFDAVRHQEIALSPKFNISNAPDRHYNMACFCAKMHELNGEYAYLEKSVDSFFKFKEAAPERTQELRDDPDMKLVRNKLT